MEEIGKKGLGHSYNAVHIHVPSYCFIILDIILIWQLFKIEIQMMLVTFLLAQFHICKK